MTSLTLRLLFNVVAPRGEDLLTPSTSLGALHCAICLSVKGAAVDTDECSV